MLLILGPNRREILIRAKRLGYPIIIRFPPGSGTLVEPHSVDGTTGMQAMYQISDGDFMLVIDVQRDFCPGGSLGIQGADAIVPVINDLGTRFPRIAVAQDWHPANHISFVSRFPGTQPFDSVETDHGMQKVFPDHCVQNTPGAELHPDLHLPHAEIIIRKGFLRDVDSNSAFLGNDEHTPTGLHGYLQERGCKRIFMVGLAFDGCVRKSAEHGLRFGYDVLIVNDASHTIDRDGSRARATEQMRTSGIAVIESAEIH